MLGKWLFKENQKTVLWLNTSFKDRESSFLLAWIIKPQVFFNLVKRILFLFLKVFFKHENQTADSKTSTSENGMDGERPTKYIVDGFLSFLLFRRITLSFDKDIAYPKSYEISEFKINDFGFPGYTSPLVTIVFVNSTRIRSLLNSLKSIAENNTVAVEILILNKAGILDVSFVERIQGIHIREIENGPSLKIDSCRMATSLSKAPFICFLNENTQVQKGWLESLIEVFTEHSDAVIASSCVIDSDLKLIEAGGTIDLNGNTEYVGRNMNAYDPVFRFLRIVNDCSGTSVLLMKNDLKQFLSSNIILNHDSGFFQSFSKSLKKNIYYQPSSVVIKGTDLSGRKVVPTSSLKSTQYQTITQFSGVKTILLIDTHLPFYDRESGSSRIFLIIKILKSLNYHLIFLPDDEQKELPYALELQQMGVDVLYCSEKFSIPVETQLKMRLKSIDVAWICRPELTRKYLHVFKNAPIKIIYDTVDLHFVRLEREEKITGKIKNWQKIKSTELLLCKKADKIIAITESDKETLISNKIPAEKIFTIPNVHIFKNVRSSFEEREGLLFIGSYVHTPNEDAVVWLCNEIMPLVWNDLPGLKVTLLGSGVTEKVKSLESDRVIVTGFIHDVGPYFENHRVFVAPLRFGAGMKGKLGQSFEYSLPIVSTAIGVEGMGLTNGKNVLIADDKAAFARQIVNLYTNTNLWNQLSKNSENAIHPFGPESIKLGLKNIFESIGC